jgi:hypothetical protein
LLDIDDEKFMKTVALLLTGFACCLGREACAANPPRGNLLELHSCELYAGGCIMSSEATLGGRYMLRAWDFTGGEFAGADLSGLSLALLQASSENLAASTADPGQAVVYLPAGATPAQRAALLGWLKSVEPELSPSGLKSRVTPLSFGKDALGYTFSAGAFLTVKTASLDACTSGACGEALWYTPHLATTVFTVAVDRSSQVAEPLLQLKWNDAGKRSVFLARFGDNQPSKNLYVSTTELWTPDGKLF